MSALEELRALLRGEQTPAVLHTCRLQAFGREHFGVEAISEAFATQPHELSDGAVLIETSRQLALFDDRVTVIADVYDGHLGRLWRIGPGQPATPEPRIDVPFDADLVQARGAVMWQASDHPELPEALHSAVRAAGEQLVSGSGRNGAYRTRTFVLRAFGEGPTAAALFAVYRMDAGPVRANHFGFAAARIAGERTTLVLDEAGDAAQAAMPWRPRV